MESTTILHEHRSIAGRLRFVREKFGQSLEAFGAEIGYDKSYLSRLESGKTSNPSVEFIEAVCSKFLVSRPWLESGTGNPFVADATTPVDWKKIMSHMSLTAKGFHYVEKEMSTVSVISILLRGLPLRDQMHKVLEIIDNPSITPGAKPYWLKVTLEAINSSPELVAKATTERAQVFNRKDAKTPADYKSQQKKD